jgi:hypothetical protein
MKLFFNLFGMALAGVLGYLMEPNLRFQLTGHKPSATEIAARGKIVLQQQDGLPDLDLEKLTAAELPERIQINSPVKVTDAATGITMTVDTGSRVKLVRIEGANVVVSPDDGPYIGKLPLKETDLLQLLRATPRTTVPEAPQPEVDTTPTIEEPEPPVPVDPVAPEETPEPQPVPEVAVVEETPAMPDPTATPQPDATPATGNSVVAAMQENIRTGEIKEFTFDQVLEWVAGEDEIVDGETYKTGTASYKAETIFGVKQLQAKALIKNGKVQRWIRPKSGLEIK